MSKINQYTNSCKISTQILNTKQNAPSAAAAAADRMIQIESNRYEMNNFE